MEALLGAVLGLIVGGAATRTHPRVNPGVLIGMLAGLLGGLLGQHWWGPAFTDLLVGQTLAGAVAAGALGGLVFAPLVGLAVTLLRGYLRQRRLANGPLSRDD